MDPTRLELLKIQVDTINAASAKHSDATISLGLAAMRGAFLLNGSAAVAVLAKQDAIAPMGAIILTWGALGAMFAVLCAGLSYLSQRFYSAHLAKVVAVQMKATVEGRSEEVKWTWALVVGHALCAAACFSFAASLGGALYALYKFVKILGA